jgi:hypothetical protein
VPITYAQVYNSPFAEIKMTFTNYCPKHYFWPLFSSFSDKYYTKFRDNASVDDYCFDEPEYAPPQIGQYIS